MKKLSEYDSTKYKRKCSKCGKIHILYTQKDEWPEYHISVYVQCKCGNYIKFTLPVN